MLQRLLEVIKPGLESSSKRAVMRKVIRELEVGECALFYIRARNAGLLLTGRENDILVEAFELLAPNENVMTRQGRLVREFPDSRTHFAVAVCQPDSCFLDEFTNALCSLDLAATTPEDKKRGTASPLPVTELVMDTIAGFCRAVIPHPITKRTREHAASEIVDKVPSPLHRSATWLLLRVALQLVLDRQVPSGIHKTLYKAVTTFHHARLLDQAIRAEGPSDVRFAMAAKIARRIKKLDPQEDFPWLRKTKEIIQRNLAKLRTRWQEVQVADAGRSALSGQLEHLQFAEDCNLVLQSLGKHLGSIKTRNLPGQGSGPGETTTFAKFDAADLPRFDGPGPESFVLLEFEAWVESSLPSWVKSRSRIQDDDELTRTKADLRGLQGLVKDYHNKASRLYRENPEALSLMCLGIMELWVAMDTIAGGRRAEPLLLQYDPGFTADMLGGLLLPTKGQMNGLRAIESYMFSRETKARDLQGWNRYPGAWAAFGKESSFAVRSFASSSRLRDILEKVNEDLRGLQQAKLQRYRELRGEYDKLVSEQATTAHSRDWPDDLDSTSNVCLPDCKACELDTKIDNLRIDTFEWPLPANQEQSKAIIFELNVPELVAIWRNTTTYLFLSVFRRQEITPVAETTNLSYARDHPGFAPVYNTSQSLMQPASLVPVHGHHPDYKRIRDITEDDVWAQEASHDYDYYKGTSHMHSEAVFGKPRLPASCSYAKHQQQGRWAEWTRSTKHTSNEVIAAQFEFPSEIPLDEVRAFGHLRSGSRLQWCNILCQLAIPSLNWIFWC